MANPARDRRDPFAALIPAEAERMPTAWHHLRIPGAPDAFRLQPDECQGPPARRFRHRTLLTWDCAPSAMGPSDHLESNANSPEPSATGDRLALIAKAIPHARYDLMLSEISDQPKSTPAAVLPLTGQRLWRGALAFVRFVSEQETRREFGLDGGRLALACNCDPFTADRESVQAAKQFHLHLLYWTAEELATIGQPQPAAATSDPRARRQLLDPLSFLGGSLIAAALRGLDFAALGARLLPMDLAAIASGRRPPGCLIELPDWTVLEQPAFETLVRQIHERIAAQSRLLSLALFGFSAPPPPWRRHPLRPAPERLARLQALGETLHLSPELLAALASLARALRDLPPASAERLKRASPATRQHCMSLNQPCYGLNLYTAGANRPEQPLIDCRPVHLLLSAKLFSGIGCAGLLPIGAIPSVRVLRESGTFSLEQWQQRSAWQQAFARRLQQSSAWHPR
jgi:hypothetical protein